MHEDLNPDSPAPRLAGQPPLDEVPPVQVAPKSLPKRADTEAAASPEGAIDLPGHTAASVAFPRDDAPLNITVDQPREPELEIASTEDALAEHEPTALDHWKVALRHDFEEWLDALDEIPEGPDAVLDADDTPDLYSFHEQLAAGNAETRKANRRTAEAFGQWGEILSKFDGDLRLLREQLTRLPTAKEDALPRPWCLVLAEILDRAVRLCAAFASPPPPSWWGRDIRWRKAWETQRQGLGILVSHLEELLQKAGVTRLSALHQPFDPATMAAIATAPDAQLPHHTVIEEVAPGYRLHGELLRVAQVKVSTHKS